MIKNDKKWWFLLNIFFIDSKIFDKIFIIINYLLEFIRIYNHKFKITNKT